ncbi:type IV pilus assembly protein PilM [bacterium]|nr:type IV pilus assembly protein PilM [bacterium]
MLGFGSRLRVGVDIGSHTIKVVAVEKAGNRQKVTYRTARPIYSGKQEYDLDGPKRSQITPILVDIFKEMKVQPKRMKNLRAVVSGAHVAAKEILALPLEEREMQSAMTAEARKHIPLDGSEAQVDFQVIGENPEDPDKVRVLVAATTKNTFNNLLETFGELEIKPTIVDLEPLSMINSWMGFNELPDEGVVVLLNIGARKTGVTVVGRTSMFFSRDIAVGGWSFTEEIMKDYGLSYEEAEKAKFQYGLKPDLPKVEKEGGGLRLASKSVLDRFGDEVNRTLRYYVKETGQSFFQKFVLVGGGAALPELEDFLGSKFNVTVDVYDPFTRMEVEAGNGEAPEGIYAGAVGIAIREQ